MVKLNLSLKVIIAAFSGIAMPVWAETPDLTASIPTLLIGLLFMVALIYVLAGVAKKTNFMQMKASGMKVLSVLPLSAREKIMLVEIGHQQFVVGVTAHSINLIKELDEPVELPKQDFKQAFGKLMQQNNQSNN